MLNKFKLKIKRAFPIYIKHKVKKVLMSFNIKSYNMVRIEASTICQLNCKACYMRINNYGSMGKGYLKFENFKRFIDNNKFVKHIELSNSGEIFLNPDLIKIIEYAYQKKVLVAAESGVNFNNVSEEMIEALVKYNFYSLVFAIDGANQEVYKKYRINGDFK